MKRVVFLVSLSFLLNCKIAEKIETPIIQPSLFNINVPITLATQPTTQPTSQPTTQSTTQPTIDIGEIIYVALIATGVVGLIVKVVQRWKRKKL